VPGIVVSNDLAHYQREMGAKTYVSDVKGITGNQLIYPQTNDGGKAWNAVVGRSGCFEKDIQFGSLEWKVYACCAAGGIKKDAIVGFFQDLADERNWRAGATFVVGLLMTLVATLLLRVRLSDQKKIERLAKAHATEIQTINEKALTANRSRDQFVAMLSHEIRTPLNGILGVFGLLKDIVFDREQLNFFETGTESGTGLLRIINDFLDYSKIEDGRLDLEETAFDLNDLVHTTIDLLAPTALEKDLQLKSEIDADGPVYVRGDFERIRQVLVNLVGNAIKFTNEGSVVIKVTKESVGKDKVSLKLEVIDTGIGIPEDRLPDLFEKFSTLSPSYQRKEGGTGLGLVISKKIISMMGGEIGVVRMADAGSNFWFTLVLDKSNESEIIDKHTSTSPTHNIENSKAIRQRFKLLMAEDNQTNCLVTRTMLEKAGFHIDIVPNGADAVQAVTDRAYDLVLTDIGMPVMNGTDAAAAIRKLPGDKSDIPIIALTAHVMKGEREANLVAGMDDYLAKPINKEMLLSRLDFWLNRNQADGDDSETDQPPATPDTGDEEHWIDEAALEQLAKDTDPELIPELAENFIEHANTRYQEIATAAASENIADLEHHAHALCSSAATFGAMRLRQQAVDIESACQRQDQDKAIALAHEMTRIAEETEAALNRFVSKFTASGTEQ
jgi:signal transduction histidine kinase/CheY-like chemotaxis protein/HPt (histidine-containing phosphotransfer) domain-containing protein